MVRGGEKLITQFVVRTASFISELLATYSNIQDGSMIQDLSTGDIYFILGGQPVKFGG